jgi:hypothetical protein
VTVDDEDKQKKTRQVWRAALLLLLLLRSDETHATPDETRQRRTDGTDGWTADWMDGEGDDQTTKDKERGTRRLLLLLLLMSCCCPADVLLTTTTTTEEGWRKRGTNGNQKSTGETQRGTRRRQMNAAAAEADAGAQEHGTHKNRTTRRADGKFAERNGGTNKQKGQKGQKENSYLDHANKPSTRQKNSQRKSWIIAMLTKIAKETNKK